ncbi:MAG: glycosyltransferase family 4 protein [Rhodocyclaceae bacterium]
MSVGINLIGNLSTATGIGHTARMLGQALTLAGYDVVGLDVDGSPDGRRPGVEHGIATVGAVADLPYRHNIVCVSIQTLPALWLRRLSGLLDARFRNAGLLYWELPGLPPALRPAVGLFDLTLATSTFVKQVLETSVPGVPCVQLEHPLPRDLVLRDAAALRAEHGIPPEAFAFCASFDLSSGVQRKNPMALVEAFQGAFPSDPDVCLVLKCNGQMAHAQRDPIMGPLLARIEADPRIRLVVQTMPYDDVMSLYAACDAYLSLHRAEGLGLGPMEAMFLGRPVIATGYSGNVGFMTEQNSMLLPYRLIPTQGAGWQYSAAFCGRHAAVWADVDIPAAIDALRRLRHDRTLWSRLAERGRRDVLERQHTAWALESMPLVVRLLDEARVSERPRAVGRLRRAELFDPVLLRLNARALAARLRPGATA